VASCFVSNVSTEAWLIDSGCTNHMTHDKELFKDLKPTGVTKVRIGHGGYIPAKGMGTITIETQSGTKAIFDVLYVPDLDQNLLSVGQLLEKGFKLYFEDKHCLIKEASGHDLFKVKMRGKSFSLNPLEEEQVVYSARENASELWHKRLGHYHYQGLLKMQESMKVENLSKLGASSKNCRACQFGKQSRLPFPKATWRATRKLQLVHTDIGGPQRTPSLKGSLYYVIFIDDLT